jgi:hypothetical protein
MRYRIKNAIDRGNVDLTSSKNDRAIEKGVLSVFSNAAVSVYKEYFQISNVNNPTNSKLKKMGHNIVYGSDDLINIIRTYEYKKSDGSVGKSNQVFSRF